MLATNTFVRIFRFVDRDMFMRYRGGGIGHKYMRAIEELYENMSRERTHHKERMDAPSDKDAMDVDDKSASDNECVGATDNHRVRRGGGSEGGSRGGDEGDEGDAGDENEGGNTGGDEEDEEDEEDEDYASGLDSDSDSSEASDSDDIFSEDDYRGDPYGFGDL